MLLTLQEYLALPKKDLIKLHSSLGHSLFLIYSLLTRQEVRVIPCLVFFVTLSFASLVLLSIYEYYVTAELVVPEVAQKLETLPQLMTQGYKLHHSCTPPGYYNITQLLEDDFRKMRIYPYLHTSLSEMESRHYVDIYGKFGKQHPRFAWILRNTLSAMYLRHVSESWLKGQYKCHLVENVGGRVALFDRVHVAMRGQVMNSFVRLREGGFEALWQNWDEISVHFFHSRTVSLERRGDFISFLNLLSFAIVMGILFIVFVLIWGVEVCCWKRGKNSETKEKIIQVKPEL